MKVTVCDLEMYILISYIIVGDVPACASGSEITSSVRLRFMNVLFTSLQEREKTYCRLVCEHQ